MNNIKVDIRNMNEININDKIELIMDAVKTIFCGQAPDGKWYPINPPEYDVNEELTRLEMRLKDILVGYHAPDEIGGGDKPEKGRAVGLDLGNESGLS